MLESKLDACKEYIVHIYIASSHSYSGIRILNIFIENKKEEEEEGKIRGYI